MPQVFRIMREDEDSFPMVAQSALGLGVRPGVDYDTDANGHVLVNGKGMSVNPDWRDAPLFRIPERLRLLKRGARGANSNACFRHGEGEFSPEAFAPGLNLETDSLAHGTITPSLPCPQIDYEAALAATRPDWIIDET